MRWARPAPARTLFRGSGRRVARVLASFAWITFTASSLAAEQLKPKLGPAAISLQQSHDYLQSHPAPDYWALGPYYEPQASGGACSLAAIAILVNALRGLPAHATEAVVTQQALLEAVGSKQWAEEMFEVPAWSYSFTI